DVFAEPQLEPDADLSSDELMPTVARVAAPAAVATAPVAAAAGVAMERSMARPLVIFAQLEKIEWDTLLFFYGVLLGVGGLGALGYLALTSELLYVHLGATIANIFIGLLSALIDNVPVMFAVLQMSPTMPRGEWLLVTLTT